MTAPSCWDNWTPATPYGTRHYDRNVNLAPARDADNRCASQELDDVIVRLYGTAARTNPLETYDDAQKRALANRLAAIGWPIPHIADLLGIAPRAGAR